jgi:UDP-glucuronate decarboxylase
MDLRIVRIFNTYGPYMSQNDGRVISNFVVQALRGDNITVYGDGTQTRSFCYVDDLIEGMVRMMNQNEFIGPLNLGNPEEYTVLELAHKVLAMVATKSEILFKPLPENDPTRRRPDISLAQQRLHWQPVVSLSQGLKQTIDYFREVL